MKMFHAILHQYDVQYSIQYNAIILYELNSWIMFVFQIAKSFELTYMNKIHSCYSMICLQFYDFIII